jgi:hypothetical protein
MRKNHFFLIIATLLITIACSEEEPAPQVAPDVDDFSLTIEENPASGVVLGSIKVNESSGSLRFSLSNQNPSGALAINQTSGELTVAEECLFNFEVRTVITAQVNVTDDLGSTVASVEINLIDVSDPVTFTIWNGPTMSFTKEDGADPSLSQNQDQISASVALTRGNSGGQIYNAVTESMANKANSPAGTLWAIGNINDIECLTFSKFRDAVGDPKDVVGKNLLLYLEAEDAYLTINFTSWTAGSTNGGGFAYTRSTE